MRQQVVLIHGGEAFSTYENYISYLKNRTVDLERMKPWAYWKTNLQKDLGDEYEVLLPNFPCKDNAKYAEWKIHFERFLPLLDEGVIFIGHSLGGIFLAKYFSENESPIPIKATLLFAAPYEEHENESLADFKLSDSLEQFSGQVEKILLFHSKDDPVVPFSDLEKYKAALPSAEIRVFENYNHFLIEEFPELIEVIRNQV